jgi:hypothetical protein
MSLHVCCTSELSFLPPSGQTSVSTTGDLSQGGCTYQGTFGHVCRHFCGHLAMSVDIFGQLEEGEATGI